MRSDQEVAENGSQKEKSGYTEEMPSESKLG